MGFNLGHWLDETFADINPFDNGRTGATVRKQRQRAAPARTISNQNRQRPSFQVNQRGSLTPNNPGLSIKPLTLDTPKLPTLKPDEVKPQIQAPKVIAEPDINDRVKQFNRFDVDRQRKRIEDLQRRSERQDTSAGAVADRLNASKVLSSIQQRGKQRQGHLGTFGADLWNEGIVNPARRAVTKVADTAQQQSRTKDLNRLLNTKQINQEQYNSGLSNIYKNSIDSKLVNNRGKLQIQAKNPFEFTKGFSQTGADLGATYAPVGTGVSLAKTGFRAAVPQVAKETAAWTAAATGADVLNDRPVTPQSIAMNAGGAALGVGGGMIGARGAKNAVRAHREATLKAATDTQQPIRAKTSILNSYEGAPDRLQVEKYKQAIRQGRPVDPIITMKDQTGRYGIEDGKHRFQAYKELGFNEVPVKVATPERVQAVAQGGYAKLPDFDPMDRIRAMNPDVPPTARITPDTGQFNQRLNTAADMAKNKYAVGRLEKTKNFIRDQYDPFGALTSIDKRTAKQRNLPYNKLNAEDQLSYLADKSLYSGRQADQLLKDPNKTGQSVAQVIQKYGEGTPQGKEFNNYLNTKFALEVADKSKGKKNIMPGQDTATMRAFVREYEGINPSAIADASTIKEHSNIILDRAADAGLISRADADFVKSYYKNYTPLSRVLPEDLARPEVSVRSLGSIGRQKVLQQLEGSQMPLDNTFNTIVGRTQGAVQQANRANLAKAYLDRVKEGTAEGDLVVGAGNTAVRKEKRGDLAKVTNARNALLDKTATTIRKELRKTTDKTTPAYKQINDINRSNVLDNLRYLPEAQRQSIIKELDNIEGTGKTVKETIAQFQDDPTTGKQMISGLIDGQPFKLEVPPEVSKVLQGMDEQKLNTVLKGFQGATRIFQTAWTGFLNPIFSGVSFAFYDAPMSVINSPLGFKTFGARPMIEMFKSVSSNADFQKQLARSGAQLSGGSQMARETRKSAEVIAAQKSLWSKIKFNSTNPKEALDSLDVLGGKFANATRTRVAKAHYINAKNRGLNERQALAEAADAYNNVLPNYGRTSALARQMNTVIPYVSASAAGTRSLLHAIGRDKTAVPKIAALTIAPAVGVTAYSLGSPEGQEFYKDMIESGKKMVLDNNWVIVLPGATKDEKTGEWSGVLKIPVPPEMRSVNSVTWQATKNFIEDQPGVDPSVAALALFDFGTGGIRTNESPYSDTFKILANKDPNTSWLDPRDLASRDITDMPVEKQVFKNTSDTAKNISKTSGGAVSPVQADAILGQFGLVGQIAQNRDNKGAFGVVAGNIENRFTKAYGKSAGRKYFDKLNEVTKGIQDPDDKRVYESLTAKDPNPGILDSAEKATNYLNRPAVLEAAKKMNEWDKEQGKPGNPLFDLSPEQLKKVLAYKSARMLNAGKQTYDKNGNSLYVSLGLDEKWHDDFKDKENTYYDTIFADKKQKDEFKTFSGVVKPQRTPELQAALDYYYTLPKGTGARKSFLAAHPEVINAWDADSAFANEERLAIGLKPTEDSFGKSSGSRYASRGRRGGGRGKGRSGGKLAYKLNGFGQTNNNKTLRALLKKAKIKAGKTTTKSPKPKIKDKIS